MVNITRMNPTTKEFLDGMLRGEIEHPYVRDVNSYKNALVNEHYLTPEAQESINRKRDEMSDYE